MLMQGILGRSHAAEASMTMTISPTETTINDLKLGIQATSGPSSNNIKINLDISGSLNSSPLKLSPLVNNGRRMTTCMNRKGEQTKLEERLTTIVLENVEDSVRDSKSRKNYDDSYRSSSGMSQGS